MRKTHLVRKKETIIRGTNEVAYDSGPAESANNNTKVEFHSENSGSKDEEEEIHEDKDVPSSNEDTSSIAKI